MLFGSSVSRSTSYKACSLTVVSKPASQYIKLILLGSHVLSFAALRRFPPRLQQTMVFAKIRRKAIRVEAMGILAPELWPPSRGGIPCLSRALVGSPSTETQAFGPFRPSAESLLGADANPSAPRPARSLDGLSTERLERKVARFELTSPGRVRVKVRGRVVRMKGFAIGDRISSLRLAHCSGYAEREAADTLSLLAFERHAWRPVSHVSHPAEHAHAEALCSLTT